MNDLRARERHIAEVLVRQGLMQLAAAFGLNGAAAHRHLAANAAEAAAPRNLRLALEELGPTFVKLGQLLSPRVYWETTTADVITLERMRGIKVTDADARDDAEVDRRALAQLAAQVTAKMVFDDNFFHGDPHPGNFFVQPDGAVVILDFGVVGTQDDQLRAGLADLLAGVVREDPGRLAAAMAALGARADHVDHRALRQGLSTLLRRYSGRSVGEIPLGRAITDFLDVARRHNLRLPADLACSRRCSSWEKGWP